MIVGDSDQITPPEHAREIAAGIQVGAKGSIAKLATALLARQASNLGMVLGGPGSQAWIDDDSEGAALALDCLSSPMTAI